MARFDVKFQQPQPMPVTFAGVVPYGSGGGEAPVRSVNGQTGDVVLTAADVGALPASTPIPAPVTDEHINGLIDAKLSGIDDALDRLEAIV